MKCLSVQQPWAWLICVDGRKRVENRTWEPLYRGPLLIHAGKTCDREAYRFLREQGIALPERFALGALIGRVRLWDVDRLPTGAFDAPGQNHWRLCKAEYLETPFPYRGRLGIFDVPDDLLAGAVWLPPAYPLNERVRS